MSNVDETAVNATKFTSATKIKFIENPKRAKSAAHLRYSRYSKATTFGQYMKLNEGKFALPDARHDLGKGFLTIVE